MTCHNVVNLMQRGGFYCIPIKGGPFINDVYCRVFYLTQMVQMIDGDPSVTKLQVPYKQITGQVWSPPVL